MASQLETELSKLKNAIIKISNLTENQIFEVMAVLLSQPISEIKNVKKTENKIDKLDLKIEDICQTVFALQQPVASDLRFIMSAMSISNEIERIADLALSIVKLSKNINPKHDLITKFDIEPIARAIESITIKTNICFQTLNEANIGEIFILNNSIKTKTNDATQNIVSEMKNNSKIIVSGTNLILALKHLERIGEHCTNVAESVYFMIHATSIRHEKNI
ncbi:phosphate transport system regulatory protein PhoU [Flavobacterium branchiophilum NBRC 15030 = ATCC 35035]|uniref:Phosphate-specific transport system accessory protein PhoU n=1 Tax=Flavobacterium branchiophilum TaxID=55197 RepID=A0A543G459_9FLAO|nr:phosphate signaling complex protein PhoU [Flavobacterium branchiophilum]OXA74621.1 phosphate transport system regulatory protein PhoU [Flavobacterium branchiophilum NBRC 15030 = ATCC 35035]TQM40871.1 PhoU-like phosphate uptake regulator [Flavobacterium branchiophilum]GEM54811.1 phosphate transport system regulatory protein PhoU [Flavobacterium branchiophilum NBRC 15030 = ATCC 35035]